MFYVFSGKIIIKNFLSLSSSLSISLALVLWVQLSLGVKFFQVPIGWRSLQFYKVSFKVKSQGNLGRTLTRKIQKGRRGQKKDIEHIRTFYFFPFNWPIFRFKFLLNLNNSLNELLTRSRIDCRASPIYSYLSFRCHISGIFFSSYDHLLEGMTVQYRVSKRLQGDKLS